MDLPPNSTTKQEAPVVTVVTDTKGQTSSNAVLALILGILSILCCGFLAGIPAIILGRAEMKAVDEGRTAESNRGLAKAGFIMGIIGAVLSCLGVIVQILFYVLGFGLNLTDYHF